MRGVPLIDLRLFTRPPFGAAASALIILGASVYGAVFLLPLYFQQLRGTTVLTGVIPTDPLWCSYALAATCLLTLHFLPLAERRRTLREVHQRLKPGAPLVVAHHSFPQGAEERERWLLRYAAFATASGVGRAQADGARLAIGARLPVLSPEQDESLLREAGFADVSLFYAGFTFRGWVAYKRRE